MRNIQIINKLLFLAIVNLTCSKLNQIKGMNPSSADSGMVGLTPFNASKDDDEEFSRSVPDLILRNRGFPVYFW